MHDEPHQADERPDPGQHDPGVVEPLLDLAALEEVLQRREPAHQQHDPEHVDRPAWVGHSRSVVAEHGDAGDPERNVDEEDQRPAELIGEPAPERGAEARSEDRDHREDPLGHGLPLACE